MRSGRTKLPAMKDDVKDDAGQVFFSLWQLRCKIWKLETLKGDAKSLKGDAKSGIWKQ